MPLTIGVVGDDGVGKTSFVRALGAQEVTLNPPRRHLSSAYLWSRPGVDSVEKTAVNIYRSREEVASDGVFVLLFDLTRRESLAAVIAQWAPLADAPDRRLLLVGTHVDCVADREVLAAEAREFAASEFHGYDEVCCGVGQIDDDGMTRIQNLLAQWTFGQAAAATNKTQSMRSCVRLKESSLCPIVTAIPTTSQSLPASPAAQQKPCMRASVWLYDPTEDVPSSPVAGAGGDVKLRAISKAIYDIRGAGAEKSKALAKYRDREMHQWLLRSRYFGPTESSRHKRWQEEQKKRQQQTHSHQHSRSRHQPSAQDLPPQQEQRGRSVSHPGKFEPPNLKPKARHHTSSRFSSSSSSSSDSEEPPTMPLERKSFMQPTELTMLRLRQLEADASQLAQEKKKRAAKRAMRKQRRAASNDLYERSSASAAALGTYMICCDELEMPLQLQPPSTSLSRKAALKTASTSSPGSWTRRRDVGDGKRGTTLAMSGRAASHVPRRAMKDDLVSAREQHELELYSPGAERVACLPTPLPTAHLQSPIPPVMSPPASPHQSTPTIPNDGGPASSKEESVSTSTDATVGATEWKSSPTKPALLAPTAYPVAGTDAIDAHVQPPCNLPGGLAASQANTVCSSASEDLDFSDIDDMLEYFEGVTLPI
ncbi:hypothetical protein BBJ28_00000999 [Nothophytophthora sp. Chile5]|nr:hypothetical protein BBJ28_00000999 [Nothophytophthora sp. Chile5]